MSFQVLNSTMAVHVIIIVMSASLSLAEWVPVKSTPLHKVSAYNESTKLYAVPDAYDYADEFTCASVHNLTMLGYAKPEESDGEAYGEDFIIGLRQKLNRQIEDSINNLSRQGRTYHIGFPSLEGALVSISLLLFAVYLIKLVMKVMYTYSMRRGTTEYIGFLSSLRQPIIMAPKREMRELELEGYKMTDLFQEQYKLFN